MCRDNGFIHNWVGSRWDRSAGATPVEAGAEPATPVPALFRREIALVREVLGELDEAQEGIFLDVEEQCVIIRAVVDAAVEHLRRSGLDAEAAGGVREQLIAQVRGRYVRRWLDFVQDEALDLGVVIDEAKQMEVAEAAFDAAMRESDGAIMAFRADVALLQARDIVH